MKFDRLQASINNNADQSPSVYMALCMVESLFTDIENAGGTELSHCPVGSDMLPSKLIWLCNSIRDIYTDNSDQLQRNRARLDSVIGKLNGIFEELEELQGIDKTLAQRQEQLDDLQRQLEERQADACTCRELTDACQKAQQQLQLLQQFDPDAARAELAAHNARISALEAEKCALSAQLESAADQSEALRQKADALHKQKEENLRRMGDLNAQLTQLQQEDARLRRELDDRKADLTALESARQNLLRAKQEAEQEYSLLHRRVNSFREDELNPAQVLLEVIRQDLEKLEQNKKELDTACDQAKAARNQLTLDIARQKEDNETLRGKLSISMKNLETMKQDKRKLDDTLSSCVDTLEKLQEEVSLLNNQRLPEVRRLQEQEQTRKEELVQSIAQAEAQRSAFKEGIAELEQRLPKLEEEVQNERKLYDALTASCTASSKELENLERQIAELRSNSNEEKLEIYRKQLQDNQRKLETIRLECSRMEAENAQLQEKLEAGLNERTRLQELKQRHESGLEVMEKKLRELEFAGSEKYVREVSALEERVRLLENARLKLGASISNMHRILGDAPVEANASLEDRFLHDLRDLRQRIDDLQRALLACAKSLKLEER